MRGRNLSLKSNCMWSGNGREKLKFKVKLNVVHEWEGGT